LPLAAIGGNTNEDLKAINYLKQIGGSMSEKLLANSDIVNGIIIGMKKSDVAYSESEDFDNFEFEEPDDLREFFELHSALVTSKHHMTPRCASCGKEVDLVEGDIIYGEDWYHGSCWKAKNILAGNAPVSQTVRV